VWCEPYGLCFLVAKETLLRAFVYIDGFNLYYRMLKKRPDLKWLNPLQLSREILGSKYNIIQLNYYTARISARAHDPLAPARQANYLKALSTVSGIHIHRGNFMTSEVWMPLATPPDARPLGYSWSFPTPDVVKVIKSEEKGSDVNLGVHLVRDAFLDKFDVAFVLTNDSDLVEPIRIVVQEVDKRVGLFAPVKFPNASLKAAASFELHVRPHHLAMAQFPVQMQLEDGSFLSRPPEWS